ncbi:MAG: hypothetical protein QXG86_01550 [Candidatus Woesearchaeota archaeon]
MGLFTIIINGERNNIGEKFKIGRDISWDDITSYDQLIPTNIKREIKKLESSSKSCCPCLKKEGEYFHYCSKGIENEKILPKFNSLDPIYQKNVDIEYLKKYCLNSYKNCPIYK